MENKIFRVFRSLKPDETKKLKKVINSPDYTATPTLKLLFKLLSRQYPNLDSSQVGKEKLFNKLYPTATYNDLKLRRHFSDLTKIILAFLNFNTLYNNTWLREKNLIEIYEKAKLYTQAKEKRQKLHALLDHDTMKNDRYWKKKIILYQMEYASPAFDASVNKEEILKNILNATDHYFAYVKIRRALVTKSISLVFNSKFFVRFLDEVKKEHQKGFLQTDGLFNLYLLALEVLEYERDDIFRAYESLFFHKTDKLYGEDQLLLFYMGLNYVVRQANRGNHTFRKTALNWYKFALKNDFLINDNIIENTNFGNIVYFGCQADELSWTLTFIEDYVEYLPQAIQQEELKHSKAIVYFHQKDYYKVIENIANYSFSSNYILRTKNLLLKSYFELFMKDATYSQILLNNIKSFESYLVRNKHWTAKVKLPHSNFCKILKKITLLFLKNTEETKVKDWITKEIEKRKLVISKNWLLEVV